MKTTSLDGDLSIGRNLALGGNATVRGDAKISHNLRVDGWLDAPNIKQPCMGLFPTATALNNAYPQPQTGWWALVGLQLPAALFIAIDGHWQFTGNTGGNPHIDLSEFTRQIHDNAIDIADMQSQIDSLSESLREIAENPAWGSGAGGGGGVIVGGATFGIAFKHNPIYASSGQICVIEAAIRSATVETDGSIVPNAIQRIDIIDTATDQALMSISTPRPSSASLSDYSHVIDISALLPAAGNRDFIVEATDDTGAKRRKQVSVVCVDATVEISGVQTLHYTEASTLAVGGMPKAISLFRFPANSSRQGILCEIEAYYEGNWRMLGTVNVFDNFPHAITINPTNLFGGGERLPHGALQLRIQGTDVASGVVGNMAYTCVMCIDQANPSPVVAMRCDARSTDVRLYDTVRVEVAAYTPGLISTPVDVRIGDTVISSIMCAPTVTYQVSHQVLGYASDGSAHFEMSAASGRYATQPLTFHVVGSVIDMAIKEGADFCFDFSSRYNSEAEHPIADRGVEMAVEGINWDTNGFCPCLGQQSLRIAENATARIPYRLFGQSTQATGCALQMAFATDNVLDPDAMLAQCWIPGTGAGFYVKGNKVGICCSSGIAPLQERSIPCGRKITISVVAEPATTAIPRGNVSYAFIKLYIDGEEAAAIAYNAFAESLASPAEIIFDGHAGDISLFYVMAYGSHLAWQQAFSNYLVKVSDTAALVAESRFEDVLDGNSYPSLEKLKALGVPYYVVVAPQSVFDDFDSGTDTSQKFSCTLFYYNPQHPCLSFRADNVQWRRQGTTSAKRPIKNDRFYLDKPLDNSQPTTVSLLAPDDTTDLGREAIELAQRNFVRVAPDGIPVKVITVKVDFSDSSGANDSGVCDMMNATFRALGGQFLTPAQRAFDGTFSTQGLSLSGMVMDHSTHNHPIAAFRATSLGMVDATFHAKGNWKEDKGEQLALGFRDTPGYNLGCLNYGDFVEFFALPGETLDQAETRFMRASNLDTSKPYLISLYCGRDYRFMRYSLGQWRRSSGTMRQRANGRWAVTGDVLNPVTGFELLSYEGFCWWQGVLSVDDMMAPSTQKSSWVQKLVESGKVSASTFPAWTFYFECMVDDDQLAVDFAMGRKVPYDLYRMLRFCSSLDYSARPLVQWSAVWRQELRLHASPQSLMAYYLFSDYLAAVDQRAKNMQPMWFLEDGASVADGAYSSEDAVRMYLNKIYDCDTCNGKDNDGGCSVLSETDPDRPTVEGEYSNPYAGWGSVLFNNMRLCPEVEIDSSGTLLSLQTVAAAMRQAQTVIDGAPITPFSPQGAMKFFVEDRIAQWPKLVSSYDGERKYLRSISRSDSIYAYALQGLGLASLPQFIEERWRFRDGCYRTGMFFSGVLSGRIACSAGASIRFRAAKDGYFGIGNDASGNLSESVYLRAGEEHTFTQFSHQTGALLYIYQADRMAMLDLSEISLDSSFDFSVLKLCSELKLGSPTKMNLSIGSYAPLSAVTLGKLPFLRMLDIRGTLATGVDASQCPRLEELLATGSQLVSCSIAPGAPISTLSLPATVAQLSLSRLPLLSYPGGLSADSFASLTKLSVSECPLVDIPQLLLAAAQSGALRQVRATGLNIVAGPEALSAIMASGAVGIAEDGAPYVESGQCSGLQGRWYFPDEVDADTSRSLNAYFPQMFVGELPFSSFEIVEQSDGSVAIVNLQNGSSGLSYTPSGHFVRALEMMQPIWASLHNGGLVGSKVSKENYQRLADNSSFDFSDSLGSGKDLYVVFPHIHVKGVDDPLRQRKRVYVYCSKGNEYPPASGNDSICTYCYELQGTTQSAVRLDASAITIGEALTPAAYAADSLARVSTIAVPQGAKWARFPVRAVEGAATVFLDEQGCVLATIAYSSELQRQGVVDGDCIVADVPHAAQSMAFSWYYDDNKGYDYDNDLVSFTTALEMDGLIPRWSHINRFAIGAYQASYDSALGRLRSLSGKLPVTQTTAAATNSAWKILELGRAAGSNFSSATYEMRKAIVLLFMGYTGRVDAQEICGYGTTSPGLTGQLDSIGCHNSSRTAQQGPVKCLGLENFFGALPELVGNAAANINSIDRFFGADEGRQQSVDKVDCVLRTLDGSIVKFANTISGQVAALRIGAKADILPAVVNSQGAFADTFVYARSTGRILIAGTTPASSDTGLFAFNISKAYNESSLKLTARLAYQGNITIT